LEAEHKNIVFSPSTSFQAWSSKVPRHAKHNFLHLSSNFWHRKLEVERKKIALAPLQTSKLGASKLPQIPNAKKISLASFGAFDLQAWKLQEGPTQKTLHSTSNF
jgi:hypothetical protein